MFCPTTTASTWSACRFAPSLEEPEPPCTRCGLDFSHHNDGHCADGGDYGEAPECECCGARADLHEVYDSEGEIAVLCESCDDGYTPDVGGPYVPTTDPAPGIRPPVYRQICASCGHPALACTCDPSPPASPAVPPLRSAPGAIRLALLDAEADLWRDRTPVSGDACEEQPGEEVTHDALGLTLRDVCALIEAATRAGRLEDLHVIQRRYETARAAALGSSDIIAEAAARAERNASLYGLGIQLGLVFGDARLLRLAVELPGLRAAAMECARLDYLSDAAVWRGECPVELRAERDDIWRVAVAEAAKAVA